MNSEQPAQASEKKIWTGGRIALAALAFSLLAVALSSSCNPTDSSNIGHTGSAPAPTAPSRAPQTSPRKADAPPQQQQGAADASSPTLADTLRDAALTTLDGRPIKVSDYEGKVVIMNLWAVWCGPCRREIPDFIAIHNDYAGRGVEVLGVTSEDERNTAEGVREFVKQFKINYKVVWVDQAGWAQLLAPRYAIPQTYVFGRDGNLLRKFEGYSPQVAVLTRGLIEQALGAPGGDGGRTDTTAK